MAAVSHWHQTPESQEAPRHGECATRLHPHVTAAIFHIKGHHLTLIVREVGGVLMYSRTNVHVFPDASLWGPLAGDPTQLRLCAWRPPHPPPTPSHVRRGARCNLHRMLKWSTLIRLCPNICRFRSFPHTLLHSFIHAAEGQLAWASGAVWFTISSTLRCAAQHPPKCTAKSHTYECIYHLLHHLQWFHRSRRSSNQSKFWDFGAAGQWRPATYFQDHCSLFGSLLLIFFFLLAAMVLESWLLRNT